jgi:Mn-dependent DtxR family transcriptional regulator
MEQQINESSPLNGAFLYYNAIMREPTLRQQQFQFLKKLYELAGGIAYKNVEMAKITSTLNIPNEKIMDIMMQLKKKNLAQFDFGGNASLTPDGVEEIGNEMEKTYAEQELLVLKTIHELSKNNTRGEAHFSEVEKAVGLPFIVLCEIIDELHDRKNYLGEASDEHLKLSPRGKEFLQGRSNLNQSGSINNITHINAPVGNLQQFTNNSNQTFTQNNITNPEFNDAITSLIELVKSSAISNFKKEDLISDIERIKQLAEEKPSSELVEHAKTKINYLEMAFKGTELATKVAPYIPQIYAFFEGLIK